VGMMKSLFNEDERYTPEALEIDETTSNILRTIMLNFKNLGFSIREISHIMQNAIIGIEAEEILKGQVKKFREKKKK
jgi:hypothetical protein